MQKKIEKVVNDPLSGMMLTYDGEPLIIISPVNHAGWRKLSCMLPKEISVNKFLNEVQSYVTEELNLYRNNRMEHWRWSNETIEEEHNSFTLYSINLRSNLGEEE